MKLFRSILLICLLQNSCLAHALAPKSQANENLLYEFSVESLLRDGYVLYSEPGQEKVLAFFLGRFHDYYQIDIFDLTTKERVGYIDFSISNFELEKWASLSTALILWQDRIYSQSAQEAADEYGLGLRNLEDVNAFREDTPVKPAPAYYLRHGFTKRGPMGWRHLGDILVGITIFAAIKEGVDRIGLDPEDSLHRSLFYERRFGALPQKGWYLDLHSNAYKKFGRVNLGRMVFDFQTGKFSSLLKERRLPGPLDVFVESISLISETDIDKIDKETKGGRFPDQHVWSFLKAISDLLGGDARERLKGWVSQSIEARGRNTIDIPLSFVDLPSKWREVAWILVEKGMIKLAVDLTDLEPLPQEEVRPITRSGIFLKFVDQSA